MTTGEAAGPLALLWAVLVVDTSLCWLTLPCMPGQYLRSGLRQQQKLPGACLMLLAYCGARLGTKLQPQASCCPHMPQARYICTPLQPPNVLLPSPRRCSGAGPAWHLQHVEVDHQGSGQRAMFLANAWLEAKGGPASLLLDALDSASPEAAAATGKYKVVVATGDVRGAGTDADMSIVLMGSGGSSQEVALESSANNFERGQVGGGGWRWLRSMAHCCPALPCHVACSIVLVMADAQVAALNSISAP
jgi:hypothetical protein